MRVILIYGASGFGREVAWLAESYQDGLRVACFIDDDEKKQGNILNDIPILSLEQAVQQYPGAKVIGGTGNPKTRELLMNKASACGLRFDILVHPQVQMSKWVEIGIGSVICAGCILTTNILLGAHTQLNLDCTIGHDVVMQEYATLAPGVHISGCVHIGKRVHIGTGAVIINGTEDSPLKIGDDAIIGAGACVTQSVPAGSIFAGVPARPLHR